jgi:hypothetical protein
MTIDDAIKHMKQARYDYCEYWEETRNDTTIAFDIAIDTMRKYQKIQEIINNAKDSDGVVKYNWLYEQIGEVLEQKINSLKEA